MVQPSDGSGGLPVVREAAILLAHSGSACPGRISSPHRRDPECGLGQGRGVVQKLSLRARGLADSIEAERSEQWCRPQPAQAR